MKSLLRGRSVRASRAVGGLREATGVSASPKQRDMSVGADLGMCLFVGAMSFRMGE